ncbi:hypothetical protein D049_0163B, partial [Vibrio parahaemolyticus VPTS-2010]
QVLLARIADLIQPDPHHAVLVSERL